MATIENKDNSDNYNIPYWKNQELPNKGLKFIDPLFPPNEKSLLGLDSNNRPIDPDAYKNGTINPSMIDFKRPNEIFLNEKYDLLGKIEVDDVIQGALGDCYFLAAVANLCKFPELILNLFKTKTLNEDGYYEIIFYIDGIKQIVIIDDYIPVLKFTNQPYFAKFHENKIWVILLEKAWAKINGGYVNAILGKSSEAFEILTGIGSVSYFLSNIDLIDLTEYKIEIIKNVKNAYKNNLFITCSTYNDRSIEKYGLVSNHAYTLLDFYQIETSNGKMVNLFRIRNPYSKGEWKGDWSDTSPLWNEKIKNQEKYNNKEDGIFFMNDKDFLIFLIVFKYLISYLMQNQSLIQLKERKN